jgi:hypothetical protein
MYRYLLIITVLYCHNGMGQSGNWYFGVKPSIGLGGVSKLETFDQGQTSERYKYGTMYGLGFRSGYRLSKYLSVQGDVEWQHIQDKRTRVASIIITSDRSRSYVYTTRYNNSFERLQLPVALHPFPDKVDGYVKAGMMPSLISSGNIKYSGSSTKEDVMVESEKLKAGFNIPANRGLEKDLIFFAGFGVSVTKRISAEVIYQFNKPMQYSKFDPRNTFVGVPVYSIRANQGLMLSALYRLN